MDDDEKHFGDRRPHWAEDIEPTGFTPDVEQLYLTEDEIFEPLEGSEAALIAAVRAGDAELIGVIFLAAHDAASQRIAEIRDAGGDPIAWPTQRVTVVNEAVQTAIIQHLKGKKCGST